MNKALFVMWHREVKKYFRNRQRAITGLVQPILFLVTFGFGIGKMYQGGASSYIQFLLPGIATMAILMSSTMNGISLIWDKQFGFLKETLVAPASRTSLLFGRCLGGATTSTIQGIMVLIISLFIGFKISNIFMLPIVILTMFSVALLFNLIGVTLATKFNDMHVFPAIMNFVIMPLVFLSGALFPIENFPKVIQWFSRINPVSYCVDLLKYSLDSPASFSLILDLGVFVFLIALLGIIGTRAFNRMEIN